MFDVTNSGKARQLIYSTYVCGQRPTITARQFALTRPKPYHQRHRQRVLDTFPIVNGRAPSGAVN